MPNADEPGLGLRKAFDEIRTAEAEGDDWLTGFVDLVDDGNLIGGDVDVTFAITDADEQGEDDDVVGIWQPGA